MVILAPDALLFLQNSRAHANRSSKVSGLAGFERGEVEGKAEMCLPQMLCYNILYIKRFAYR
jgi:hypothetical protein